MGTCELNGAIVGVVEKSNETPVPKEYSEFFGPEYFGELAALISKEKLPADALLSCFTKGRGNVPFLTISHTKYSDSAGDRSLRFQILAPTEDNARGLASTMLVLFDQGLTRQLQIQLHKSKRAAEGHLEKKRKELKEAEEESEQLREQLQQPVEVDPDSLADLSKQRHLLIVDIAGAKARIMAAERFLDQKERLSPDRIGQVENIKIAAEIEFAGLAARQNALDSLVRRGK